jgi:hypothetical protein
VAKNYNPQRVFSKIFISNFTNLYAAIRERQHVVEGQTDGPMSPPVMYRMEALSGKENAHNLVPSITTILLSLVHTFSI